MDDNKPVFFLGDEVLVRAGYSQGEQLFEDYTEGKEIVLGVCAMKKKSHSKPMHEILERLEKFMHIKTFLFDEDVILLKPIEEWPVVDVLISFFSSGFPLDKAIEYAKLRKSFMINDLEAQYLLLDRRNVYKTLAKEGIAHPRYAELNREDNGSTEAEVNDSDDSITVNNMVFQKPFVEKPVCAEDHRVYIYFPVSAGGGSQRLFRKVGSRSSVYSSESKIRKNGSYIYEDFMPTDGTDVKVYTVGPDYAHAEARKSPVLDGKVERDKNGKEIRYPVLLSAKEKLLARKVCLAFKQNVCGFDLLRANGQSYVCDVNGFSFVKNSVKYYDDCAKILGTMIMRALAPQLHIPWVLGSAPEDIPVVPTTSGSMMELRCVVAVIRHGDRTPKQKMKMEVKHKRFFDLFQKYDGFKTGHLKLKKPKQLQEVLDIARFLLTETKTSVDPELVEKEAKLQQLKLVLEMYGHFSGINRKVQLKYQPHGHPQRSSSEEDEIPREPSLLLIVKWGGELTPAGKIQAEGLGKAFRTLYPGGQGQFETPGLGFLRLHSTFRHDLKIYASDEGRVQMTAAAFTKGLLALEGELTPILVQMVKSANTNGLLDKQGETSKYQHVVKERLTHILNNDKELDDADYIKIAPTNNQSLLKALDVIKNPQRLCVQVHKMVKELTSKVKLLQLEHRTRDLKLYNGESWELLIRRWSKLEKDFKMKDGRFDVSKISDIYDCIKYDIQHNQKTLQYDKAQELFNASKALADIVIPQEYGITVDEKLHISQSICTPLMRKIRSDLQQCMEPSNDDESTRLNSKYSKGVASPERFVRTRLYFTSESHLHSLINMMKYGGLCDENEDEQWLKAVDYINATEELNYMTQIIIMMFEDPSKDPGSAERFHIELHFSPGAYIGGDKDHNFSVSKNSKQHFTKPSKPLDLEFTNTFKKAQERPVSAPMIIREQEEYEEFDIFDHGSKESHHMLEEISENSDESVPKRASVPKKKVPVPEPQSPDPEIPEWDWGSDPEDKEKPVEDKKASKNVENSSSSAPGSTNDIHQSSLATKSCSVPSVSTNSVSQPIAISPNPKSQEYLYEPVRSQSLDEKRSRSLEDKQPDPKPTPFVDRHYLTVHLPLPSDRQRYSCSSLFLLNADAFKDQYTLVGEMSRAKSASVIGANTNAFEGFSMVPSLRPLETLHNRLTVKQLDSFLKRATTSKFVTPISSPPVVRTPLASPHVHVHKAARKAHSQPSSSNSSTGPSSPTSAVAPIMDAAVFKKLQKIVIDKQESKESDKSDITLVDNSDITLVNNSDVTLVENSDVTLANKSEVTLVDDESSIT